MSYGISPFQDPSKPQFWALVFICIPIGLILSMIWAGREKGKTLGESLEPFTTIFWVIGSIIKWIFKGLGFLLVFIFALFRKEAPPSSSTPEQEEDIDIFEDDEGKPRKPRKIDEYHV